MLFGHDVELWESKVLLTLMKFSLTCLFLSMPTPVALPLRFCLPHSSSHPWLIFGFYKCAGSSISLFETLYGFKYFNSTKMPTPRKHLGILHNILTFCNSQETSATSRQMHSITVKSISRTFWEKPCLCAFGSWKHAICGFCTACNCPRNLQSLMTCSRTQSASKNVLVLRSSSLICQKCSIYTNKKYVFKNKQISNKRLAYIS